MIKASDEIYTPFHLSRVYDYSGPFKSAIPVAEHYGFRLIKPIKDSQPIVNRKLQVVSEVSLAQKHASLSHYLENQPHLSNPSLLCHTYKATNKYGYLTLEVYGSKDSFVETLLLKSAFDILQGEGFKNLLIEINSFGSADSFSRFESELKRFVQKNLERFSKNEQNELKKDVYSIYEINQENSNDIEELLLHLPRPVAYLSENCRIHLKQLLEHLESSGLPYQLNPRLFPHASKHSETVFKILDTSGKKEITIAYGERYSSHAKTIAGEKHNFKIGELDCAAITLALKGGQVEKYIPIKNEKKQITEKVYFAHVGDIAKKNSLAILEQLHQAKIPVKHAVIKDSLREQLHHADKQLFPLTLILGVKEVQDGTILLRDNIANKQKAVPISQMCSHIKRALKSVSQV